MNSQLEVTISQIFSSWVTFMLLIIVGFALLYFADKRNIFGKKNKKSHRPK
jgi:hypothetical protein